MGSPERISIHPLERLGRNLGNIRFSGEEHDRWTWWNCGRNALRKALATEDNIDAARDMA
jgi:hypothetical protein